MCDWAFADDRTVSQPRVGLHNVIQNWIDGTYQTYFQHYPDCQRQFQINMYFGYIYIRLVKYICNVNAKYLHGYYPQLHPQLANFMALMSFLDVF